ncbi:MAG: glycosyltransferase family 4 protein [Acidobacteriota bacterium]|nr:glycosyltransferase family 4 protein [Acidobacteriota bacterium]
MTFIDLAVAALVCALAAWLTWHLSRPASALRLLDHPNERSLHQTPLPRTGGLAILVALGAGLLARWLISLSTASEDVFTATGWWTFLCCALVALVSFWDDWAEVGSGVRFAVHLTASCCAVFGANLVVREIDLPLIATTSTTISLGWLAAPLTVLWLVWMTNLYNFMDGMDGFAGGMSVCGFAFLSTLAWVSDHTALAVVAALTAAGAFGFLVFNFPPARIFMGDVGSTVLGFLAGALAVWGVRDRAFAWPVPVLVFAPFIVDATVTLARRLLRGERVWQAHREHYYQRLVLAGWTHRRTALAEYALMIFCGASAILYSKIERTDVRAALLGLCVAVITGCALGVRRVEQKRLRVDEIPV